MPQMLLAACCMPHSTNAFYEAAKIATGSVRKDLFRINQAYYWRSFCTTCEHYNYLQLIWLIKMESIYNR